MKKLGKKFWIPVSIAIAVVSLFVIIFPIIWCCVINVDLKVKATQVEESQVINVKWETSKQIDKLKLTVKHGGDLVSELTITDNAILQGGELNVDAFYGKQTVIVKIYRGAYFTSKKVTVALTASEYNFAPITATMPVTIFSLSLDSITENGTIPTFVWFKRSGAWDWTNLPQGVYPMPVATNSELMSSTQVKMYKKTSAYIKELYELNKDSFFNLFYNDYYNYGWVQATIGNGIPEENYHVTLLSDGTASFQYFNKHFDVEGWEDNYAKMAKEWKTLKSQVAKRHKYAESSIGFEIKAGDLREYSYVMVKEQPNVEWWLTRIDGTMAPTTRAANTEDPQKTTIYTELSTNEKVKVKDLNGLLTALDETQRANLKKLYKFNDAMFEKAQTEHKKVMVFLGTWTQNETDFDNYVRLMQDYYGDEYVYYYKGHPKNPTGTVDGKMEHLEKLGLIDIDSTIAAEIIIFFNPDIYLSGYQTSTFLSVAEDQACGVFLEEKGAFTQEYKDRLDFFAKKIGSHSQKAQYSSLGNDDCYVLEFNDTTNYDIAIYNPKTRVFKYYKKVNDAYQEVQA